MSLHRQPYREERGVLRYDKDYSAFYLDDQEDRTSIHCGDVIGIRIGDRYAWGRVELDRDNEWYIIFFDATGQRTSTFTLRTGATYDTKIRNRY